MSVLLRQPQGFEGFAASGSGDHVTLPSGRAGAAYVRNFASLPRHFPPRAWCEEHEHAVAGVESSYRSNFHADSQVRRRAQVSRH